MGTTLHTLRPPEGARKRKKRVGRGIGSHRGKTSGRGMKGQLARHNAMPVAFEGGQNPIHRRVPKRGFVRVEKVVAFGVNLGRLDALFDAGSEVTLETLRERGIVPKKATIVKLLGDGEITKPMTVRLHRASESARRKLEAVGGTFEAVEVGK